MRNPIARTRLEMHTDIQGVTHTRLLFDGKDISSNIHGLSLHVREGEPITAELILRIDEVEVSAGVVQNIVAAVLPDDLTEQLRAYLSGEQYDGSESTVNRPETFG